MKYTNKLISITRSKLRFSKSLNQIYGTLVPIEIKIAVEVLGLQTYHNYDDVMDFANMRLEEGKSYQSWIYFKPKTGMYFEENKRL